LVRTEVHELCKVLISSLIKTGFQQQSRT